MYGAAATTGRIVTLGARVAVALVMVAAVAAPTARLASADGPIDVKAESGDWEQYEKPWNADAHAATRTSTVGQVSRVPAPRFTASQFPGSPAGQPPSQSPGLPGPANGGGHTAHGGSQAPNGTGYSPAGGSYPPNGSPANPNSASYAANNGSFSSGGGSNTPGSGGFPPSAGSYPPSSAASGAFPQTDPTVGSMPAQRGQPNLPGSPSAGSGAYGSVPPTNGGSGSQLPVNGLPGAGQTPSSGLESQPGAGGPPPSMIATVSPTPTASPAFESLPPAAQINTLPRTSPGYGNLPPGNGSLPPGSQNGSLPQMSPAQGSNPTVSAASRAAPGQSNQPGVVGVPDGPGVRATFRVRNVGDSRTGNFIVHKYCQYDGNWTPAESPMPLSTMKKDESKMVEVDCPKLTTGWPQAARIVAQNHLEPAGQQDNNEAEVRWDDLNTSR